MRFAVFNNRGHTGKRLTAAVFVLFVFAVTGAVLSPGAAQRDRFVFTQLQYAGDWDPYPAIYQDILSFLALTTSIESLGHRRTVRIKDEELFYSPFVVMLNNGRFDGFTAAERDILRKFLNSGGSIFIEDSSGNRVSGFNREIREEIRKIFPEKRLTRLPREHVLFRSFYLLRGLAGRCMINNFLEGMDIAGRTALIYSQNDIFGAWARDRFGNYFYECLPGGEQQRFEAQKLTINLCIFSLTGTYKSDFIHKPFIEEKLRK
ncbi:MAG: DUF4159 domain-containing protein [Elusimicrobiota bacterium]